MHNLKMNAAIWIPLLVWMIVQFFKFLFDLIEHKKMAWSYMKNIQYSGYHFLDNLTQLKFDIWKSDVYNINTGKYDCYFDRHKGRTWKINNPFSNVKSTIRKIK